jgi:uncharacterized protein
MDLFRGTTALVTGASRGIGAAIAEELARRGADLVLVARHAEPLDALARRLGGSAVVLAADLGRPDAGALLEAEITHRGLTIDHLINNAGIGPVGRFDQVPTAEHLATVDLNIRAVTELASRFLPGMIERRRGGLLNIASTAASQGLLWMPVYSASKAYVVAWSEAVWVRLRGTGVRCCSVWPGPVDTPFFEVNQVTPPPRWWMQSAATVAGVALRAYERDDCHVITSLPFRLTAWSTRLVPRALAARLGAFYGKPK